MIPCSAEYSYGQCGGDDGFWGGGQFGDHVAYDRQTLGDVDPETQEFISRYLEQISNSQARYFIITYEKKPEEDDVVATFLIFYDAYEESNPQAANPRFYEDSVTVYQFLPRFWQGLNIMRDISAAMVDNFTFGQYSRLQNAYSRWMYGTRVINTQSDVYQDTDTSVTVFGIALPGPGGKANSVRNLTQRSFFLKQLAANGKAPKWMKNWLIKDKVPPRYNVDHIKPLSVGGTDTSSNMRLVTIADHILHHRYYRPWKK